MREAMRQDLQFVGDPIPQGDDLPIAKRPDDPNMRDGINVWFFEKSGEFGVPRIAIDAVGPDWDNRVVTSRFVFPSRRVLDSNVNRPGVPVTNESGRPNVLGASSISFRCIEPMRQWHLTYDDVVIDGDVESQLAGTMDPQRTTPVRVDAVITYNGPLWTQIFADDDASSEAGWLGRGWRYEVLCDVVGKLEIDGKERDFEARGNLIRRKSKRSDYLNFPGHLWLAAKFPDGRGFGCNVFAKQGDRPQYNTGYIYQDGKAYPATVVEAPWLGDLVPEGEDMPVVLESELGKTRIEGTSLLATFQPSLSKMGNAMGGLNLGQGGVRFTWDDQTAIGMSERSSFGKS